VLVVGVAGPILVGALIGGEGFFGIFMPALVGGFSDRNSRTVRDRSRLLAVFAVVVVLAIPAIGVIAAAGLHSILGYAVALVFLYAGYYAFPAPYWALYPDLVPKEQSGRSPSAESTWRVIGVGLALIGGGLLLDVWAGLPFFVAGGVATVVVGALMWGLRHRQDDEIQADDSSSSSVSTIRDLLRDSRIRRLCLANALWNFALASLRAFVVLFFTAGLGKSSSFVSTIIFPLVAVGIAVAAPRAGWAADKWGHVRLLTVSLGVYGVGMALPGIWQYSWIAGLIPVVAAGAATVMTLPFSVLMRLLPEEHNGAASGLFGFSRGVGATLGPVVTGTAILLLAPVLHSTHGYAAMWLVCSAALLVSILLLWSLRGDERL
jgi:Na+/melibiose symporter-like transporter